MDNLAEVFRAIRMNTIEVPVWEVFALLVAVLLCMLIRGSKMALLITYVFTLHTAFNFLKLYFGPASLLILGILGTVILLIGLYDALTDR